MESQVGTKSQIGRNQAESDEFNKPRDTMQACHSIKSKDQWNGTQNHWVSFLKRKKNQDHRCPIQRNRSKEESMEHTKTSGSTINHSRADAKKNSCPEKRDLGKKHRRTNEGWRPGLWIFPLEKHDWAHLLAKFISPRPRSRNSGAREVKSTLSRRIA